MNNLSPIIENIIPTLSFKFPYGIEEYASNLFVENYHKHSSASNAKQIDSPVTMNDYAKRTKEVGGKCLFSGEHGWQGQYYDVYEIANANELNFRYSVEAYFVKDRLEKDSTNCHMMLIAKNIDGLKDINFILSKANEDGYYFKPRIDFDLLSSINPKNVIVTSACVAGWKYDDSDDMWLKINDYFGNNFFFEIQYHNTDKQKQINQHIKELSKKHSIDIIAGLDSHYIYPEEATKRDYLLEDKGIFFEDEQGWYMDFPFGKEIYRRFKEQNVFSDEEILRAMMNTCLFIDECENVTFDKSFKIPSVLKGYDEDVKNKVLHDLLLKKYEMEEFKSDEKFQGMEYELSQITESGIADYFLTNHIIIRDAIKEFDGILTNTGRGSAGSFVCNKLLGFTTLDRCTSEIPIYPERFLTKERIQAGTMPDIDFNISKQEPFVQSAKKIVGEYGIYPLIAFNTMKAKAAWKMYARVNNVDMQTANLISSQISKYEEDYKYADDMDKESLNIADYIDKKYLDLYNQSIGYQGMIVGCHAHPCGFLLYDGDIRRDIGITRCVSETGKKSSILTTVIDGSVLDKFGFVKDDFLIVDTVTLTDKFYTSIGKKVPVIDDLRKMVENDKEVWDLYKNGCTMGLNQCEREKTIKKVMKYKPTSIQELCAFIAAIRPGFSSLIDVFINRESYTTGEEQIDDLLEDSFHFLLYQESIMKILQYLGIDMGETYNIIKKISKKKLKGKTKEDLEKKLHHNWIKMIGNDDNFDKVWNVINDSANYAFNSPHSLSMACDSLYAAWFKAHYTSKFYEVSLNHYLEKDKKDKIKDYIKEAVNFFGYTLADYSFKNIDVKFKVDDKNKIIYPVLTSVKGLGDSVTTELMQLKNEDWIDFIDIYEHRGKINKTQFRKLVDIGVFSEYGSRKYLNKCLDIWDTFEMKQINKDKLQKLGLTIYFVSKYGRETAKQIKDIDSVSMRKDLINMINKYTMIDTPYDDIRAQFNILESCMYINANFDSNIVYVYKLQLNQYGTAFASIYYPYNGNDITLKVDKTAYKENPIEQGYFYKIKTIYKKKKKNQNNEWIELEDLEKIIIKYQKIC